MIGFSAIGKPIYDQVSHWIDQDLLAETSKHLPLPSTKFPFARWDVWLGSPFDSHEAVKELVCYGPRSKREGDCCRQRASKCQGVVGTAEELS